MPSLTRVRRGIRKVAGPAPMLDFDDYDEYWDRRGELAKVLPRWEAGARLIPDGATVLDVGCGSAEFLRYLVSQRPGVVARGVDFSAAAVDMAREAGFEAEQLDLASGELPGQFDYVTCFELLEHLPDAEVAIGRLARGARRQLIISVPNVGYVLSRIRLGLFGRFPNTNCVFHIKEHVRHWTPKDFAEWTAHLGLRVVHQEGQNGVPWLWRRWPVLFASGMVYVIDTSDRSG